MASKQVKQAAQDATTVASQRANQLATQSFNNAGNSEGRANDALTTYSNNVGAATNPYEAASDRNNFNTSINALQSQIAGIQNSPGYSQSEQARMKQAAIAPIAGAYRGAQGTLANNAVRTGSATGIAPEIAKLAQMKGMDMSTAQAGQAQAAADARRSDTQFATTAQAAVPGMYGTQQNNETQNLINGLSFPVTSQFQNYATNVNGQIGALGADTTTSNTLAQQASQPGFWEKLLMAGVGNAASTAQAVTGAK